jgi:hypothetical protein
MPCAFDDDCDFDRYGPADEEDREEYEPSVYNGDAWEEGVADEGPESDEDGDGDDAPDTDREAAMERAGEQAFEDALFPEGPDMPEGPEPPEHDFW